MVVAVAHVNQRVYIVLFHSIIINCYTILLSEITRNTSVSNPPCDEQREEQSRRTRNRHRPRPAGNPDSTRQKRVYNKTETPKVRRKTLEKGPRGAKTTHFRFGNSFVKYTYNPLLLYISQKI